MNTELASRIVPLLQRLELDSEGVELLMTAVTEGDEPVVRELTELLESYAAASDEQMSLLKQHLRTILDDAAARRADLDGELAAQLRELAEDVDTEERIGKVQQSIAKMK